VCLGGWQQWAASRAGILILYEEQDMTTQQTGQPSQSTKHADEDMKGQHTAPTGFIASRRPCGLSDNLAHGRICHEPLKVCIYSLFQLQ